MGHTGFERDREDRVAHKEWRKKEEELWANMASPVAISYKEVDRYVKPLKRRKPRTGSRAMGTNPRAVGTNPRAVGTNPRAVGTNPRAVQVNKLRSQVSI